jgi:hypothetical protein
MAALTLSHGKVLVIKGLDSRYTWCSAHYSVILYQNPETLTFDFGLVG